MTATVDSPASELAGLHGADFSADRQHRLLLWRLTELGGPFLGYLMLNPSTADERQNDSTTAVNRRRAALLGYKGIVQANLYTYRTPSPAALKAAGYPGARDEASLGRLADLCQDIVLSWGEQARPDDAAHAVGFLLARSPQPRLWHLGLTKARMPRHPLRVPYSQELQRLPVGWEPLG